jgi:hypothetical protein
MRRMLTAAASVVFVLGVAAPAASASTAPVTQVIKVTAVQNSSSFHGMSFPWGCPALTDRVVGSVRLPLAGPFVPPWLLRTRRG